MKITKQIIPSFKYPENIKLYIPYSPTGLGEYINWPEDLLDVFDGCLPGAGRNIFVYQLFQKLKKDNVKKINYLEVGTFLGRSLIELYKTSSLFDIEITSTVVDTFEGTKNEEMENFKKHYDQNNSFKSQFLKNIKNNNITNLNIFEGFSDDFFNQNTEKFDLIYIDADHSYDAVKRDINNSLKFIKSGGNITGDDYHPCWGVFDAVNSISTERSIKVVGEMWYFSV